MQLGGCPFTEALAAASAAAAATADRDVTVEVAPTLEHRMEDALHKLANNHEVELCFEEVLYLICKDKDLAYFKDDDGNSPISMALRHCRPDVLSALLPYYRHILIPHDVTLALAQGWIELSKSRGEKERIAGEAAELQAQIGAVLAAQDQDRIRMSEVVKEERRLREEAEEKLKVAQGKIDRACTKMLKTRDRLWRAEEELKSYEEVDELLPKNMSQEQTRRLLVKSLRKNGIYRKQLKKQKVSC